MFPLKGRPGQSTTPASEEKLMGPKQERVYVHPANRPGGLHGVQKSGLLGSPKAEERVEQDGEGNGP